MDFQNTDRKVVLIKGDKTKAYEQAIFIMRAGAVPTQIDFVQEAERIVGTHNFAQAQTQVPVHAGTIPKMDYTSYAKAEMLPPPQPATRANKTKQPKKRSRFDAMLNLALITTAAAILILFYLNFM